MKPESNDIWREVHQRIGAFIARRVSNQDEADDILQEVFLRIHRRLGSLKNPRRLVPWVFQIARHAIVDHYRASARQREAPAGLAGDLDAAHPHSSFSAPEGLADSSQLREEMATCLRPMIARLPARHREAVTLVELDGLTQADAAKRLGLSVSGMKSRVQRGRHELKRLLDECCVIELDRRGGLTDYAVRDAQPWRCGSTAILKPIDNEALEQAD